MEEQEMEIVLPFVVVESAGGEFQDAAFVAGFQAGEIDARLAQARLAGATSVKVLMVRRALLPQLELHGMRYGFAVLDATEPHHDLAGSDEWCDLTFSVVP